MIRLFLALAPLLFLANCAPAPPPHPARAPAEAAVLPLLHDSASYVFRQLVVDTVLVTDAIATEIALEEDRRRQYIQRIGIRAQAYLSAAGSSVSDRDVQRVAEQSGIVHPEDSLIQSRIDSLSALTPAADAVDHYLVVLAFTAKDESGIRREMYRDVAFTPDWALIEVREY
jgi:hypothetical protein